MRCELVAQLDRVFDYESKGRGFESLRARQNRIPNFGVRFFLHVYMLNEKKVPAGNLLFIISAAQPQFEEHHAADHQRHASKLIPVQRHFFRAHPAEGVDQCRNRQLRNQNRGNCNRG